MEINYNKMKEEEEKEAKKKVKKGGSNYHQKYLKYKLKYNLIK
jgi:hypothetical protein